MTTFAATTMTTDEIAEILENDLFGNKSEPSEKKVAEPEPEPVADIECTEWVATEWNGVEMRVVPSHELFAGVVRNIPLVQYRGFTDAVCHLAVPEVPKVYEPHKESLNALIMAAGTGLKPMLYGHTGTGKTSLYEYFAAMLGRPFVRTVFDATTDDQKLYGSLEVKSVDGAAETYFNKSDLSYSLDFPAVAVMDEFSRANAEQTMLVNPLLDRRQVTVTSHDDKSATITAHANWFVGGTDNSNGTGDDMDIYNSSNVLDEAIRNRFDIWSKVPYASETVEHTIISLLSPEMPESEKRNLARFSRLMHKGYEDRKIRTAFSVRNIIAITDMYKYNRDVKACIDLNFKARVAKSETADIAETVRSIWGG